MNPQPSLNGDLVPVSKDGKLFGYADPKQVAASNGKLKVFDPTKARVIEAEQAVEAAKLADKDAKDAKKAASEGAPDPTAVKKGPAKDAK